MRHTDVDPTRSGSATPVFASVKTYRGGFTARLFRVGSLADFPTRQCPPSQWWT